MIGIQQPDRPQQFEVAQAIRGGFKTINNRAVDCAVGGGERTWVKEHSGGRIFPSIPDRLRARRELEGNTEREIDSLGRSIAYGEVNHVDVVDDLASFLFAIDLLNIPYEMLVGILPAMTDRDGPRLLFLIRGRAQTGRADAGDHSALTQSVPFESDDADQNADSQKHACEPHASGRESLVSWHFQANYC